MASTVNFRKDPLGLMSGQIPKDYLKIVQSLIRPDEPPPVQQTDKKPNVCPFCQKAKHKYPIFCRKLKKLNPRHILYIMRNNGIQCHMCLDTTHLTEDCKQIKNNIMQKCHITVNGVKCNQYHCKYLHEY